MSTLVLEGRCSWFGGPNDHGVGPDEGLALVSPRDLGKYPGFFLPPGKASGLARRLDPDAHYIACRWDYGVTPRQWLQHVEVQVINQANGKTATARPVDWGPNTKTHRVADLSPGLLRDLGLQTDGKCRVIVPLPH